MLWLLVVEATDQLVHFNILTSRARWFFSDERKELLTCTRRNVQTRRDT